MAGPSYPPPPQQGQLYPPLPGKGGAAPGPTPVQVVTQVQYVQAPSFGTRPVTMVCPNCQNNVTTKTVSEPSALAWIIGGVLCFMGFWPCACIPCCVSSLDQVILTSYLPGNGIQKLV